MNNQKITISKKEIVNNGIKRAFQLHEANINHEGNMIKSFFETDSKLKTLLSMSDEDILKLADYKYAIRVGNYSLREDKYIVYLAADETTTYCALFLFSLPYEDDALDIIKNWNLFLTELEHKKDYELPYEITLGKYRQLNKLINKQVLKDLESE